MQHGDGQNPAYRPSGVSVPLRSRGPDSFFFGAGLCLRRSTNSLYRGIDGEAETIRRLGIPALAVLWRQGPHAAKLRLCDREGCGETGDRPAPKAPHSKERWYFCEAHAAEYNKNWNYFAGLSPEEAARRAAEEEGEAKGFRQSAQWKWGGPGDGTPKP